MARADAAARVLENPFVGDPGAWQQSAERLLASQGVVGARADDASLLRSTLARALALTVVRGESPATALSPARVPERLLARLGRPRRELVRLVAAAARAQRALGALAGVSSSLRAARAAAWSASFGASLLVTGRLERVIREHDVLVTGETGAGKDAIAHAIALGTLGGPDGGEAPFAALNIAAFPETLVESELFGHARGAFTGASTARVGHIRSVASGCLFLDEVGDLPPTAQSKLLRVMETDRVTPLGSDTTYDADVRYIAATHKDLRAMVASGAFREDLYERLAGNVIRLPALRERIEDVLPIGLRFAERYLEPRAPEWRQVRSFLESREARAHAWPGNVRELQNCLRNVLLGLDPGLLPEPTVPVREPTADDVPARVRDGRTSLADVEGWYVTRVFERSAQSYAVAARVLELDRSTVRRKLRQAATRSG